MISAPQITALIAHVRRVPAAERQTLLARLTSTRPTGLLLDTCHRVELYVADAGEREQLAGILPRGAELISGEEAVRHAIAVAVGLDSVVIGEDQILHQLRATLGAARAAGTLDPVLERLFTHALRAGRRARSWRQGRSPSLADAALAAIERRIGPIAGRRLLVVGSGEVARLAVAAASAAGADVSIASRTRAHANALARRFNARTVPFDPGTTAGDFAAVVVALRGPWALAPATAGGLAAASAAVVDLSVPTAVPAPLADALGERFVSSDALATSEPHDEAAPSTERAERLVDAAVSEFLTWYAGRDHRDAASALTRWADAERQAELDRLWRRHPDLPPDARHAIDAMSRHLAERILREPLERLGRDEDGRAERATRELFAL